MGITKSKQSYEDRASIMLFITLAIVICFAMSGCGGQVGQTGQNGTSSGDNLSDKNSTYPVAYGIEVKYCEEIGYSYDYRLNESTGRWEEYCRLSDTIECPAWDFVDGLCHRELMLCALEGHTPKIGVIKENNQTITFPICIFSDGTYCKEIDFFNKKCHVKWE